MYVATPALHVTNLTGLVWLRSICARAPDDASELFDLPKDSALCYAQLSDQDVNALCADLDVSVFVPRLDNDTLPSAIANCGAAIVEHHPTELALNNLAQMQALCEMCQRSLGEAVWTYRLNTATAAAYRALQHEQVVALCSSLCVAAYIPRYGPAEVQRILAKPAGMRALFAAAYETDIDTPGTAVKNGGYLTR